MSQSLFYWNPFCNTLQHDIGFYTIESQSLFYWNPFCNIIEDINKLQSLEVAILILLESFLQYLKNLKNLKTSISRNPYFIGILSAILYSLGYHRNYKLSQSLFYWNPFCNLIVISFIIILIFSRNPYFIGILSAIVKKII